MDIVTMQLSKIANKVKYALLYMDTLSGLLSGLTQIICF